MEQSTTAAATANTPDAPVKRPVFLTVLCIVSFVGIGLNLFFGIVGYFTYSTLASTSTALNHMAEAKAGEAIKGLTDLVVIDYHKLALASLIQALINLPILAGVLFMWKRMKTGFFIYAAFEIIQPLVPLILGIGLFVGGLQAILGSVSSIVFIVLYALNLKHMHFNKKKEKASGKTSTKKNQASGPAAPAEKYFYENRISNVSCVQAGTGYKVSMMITAKKFMPDSKPGVEKEIVINDEIQIGMLKGGKEMYLKSYRFTKPITVLTITLEQKPEKIGIDPYNKLPERAL